MQNRDFHIGNGRSDLASGCSAGYRVMVRGRDGRVALVCYAGGRQQAVQVAGNLRDRLVEAQAHRRDRDCGVAAIYVETWVGTALEGQWEHCGPRYGGFCHVFRRENRQEETSRGKLPKSGDTVACVLLARRTRKGGWRASLADRRLPGSVTNGSEMPATAQPGQRVALRVGAVASDGSHIQFTWVPNLAIS